VTDAGTIDDAYVMATILQRCGSKVAGEVVPVSILVAVLDVLDAMQERLAEIEERTKEIGPSMPLKRPPAGIEDHPATHGPAAAE
jgi:hypothetical protein